MSKQFIIKEIIQKINDLDEIGGANDLTEYIEILSAVKIVIDKRLNAANEVLEKEEKQPRDPSDVAYDNFKDYEDRDKA